MVEHDRHLATAQRNESFFLSFDLVSTPYLDWAVTALFYAALHYVEAYLGQHNGLIGRQVPSPAGGHHATGHRERFQKIESDAFLSVVQADYRQLYDRSIDARYNLSAATATDVLALFQNQYRSVKEHILPRL